MAEVSGPLADQPVVGVSEKERAPFFNVAKAREGSDVGIASEGKVPIGQITAALNDKDERPPTDGPLKAACKSQ